MHWRPTRQLGRSLWGVMNLRLVERKMETAEILKKPYARVVVPETDGSFTAEILEFPGCVASGDSAAEAFAALEDIASDWIAASLEQGQAIPEPLDHSKFSGKLVVRMPKGLHKRAAQMAQRDGVSLNQFIVTCIAEEVGERARPLIAYPMPQPYFALGVIGVFSGSFPPAPNITLPAQAGTYQISTSASQPVIGVTIHREKAYARS
jgi:predicted HicB family RNase H-like nuclease